MFHEQNLYTPPPLATLTLKYENSGQLSCTLAWGQRHSSQGLHRPADLIGQFVKQQEMQPGVYPPGMSMSYAVLITKGCSV